MPLPELSMSFLPAVAAWLALSVMTKTTMPLLWLSAKWLSSQPSEPLTVHPFTLHPLFPHRAPPAENTSSTEQALSQNTPSRFYLARDTLPLRYLCLSRLTPQRYVKHFTISKFFLKIFRKKNTKSHKVTKSHILVGSYFSHYILFYNIIMKFLPTHTFVQPCNLAILSRLEKAT